MRETSDHPSDTPDLRAPVGRLAACVLGAVVICVALAFALAQAVAPEMTGAVVIGGVCALLGSMLGLVPSLLAARVKPLALAIAQVAASTTRLFVGAGAAVAAVLIVKPDPVWTLAVLLVCMLAALAAELIVIMPVIGANKPTAQGAL